jgi:hypothetical protein
MKAAYCYFLTATFWEVAGVPCEKPTHKNLSLISNQLPHTFVEKSDTPLLSPDTPMKSHIQSQLAALEAERDIKILYAVESGSRAWGFASPDSDWDVRFLYVHRPEWYLSIDDHKDSIEQMLPQDLDLSGWELRKALRLFRKSNPPLLEWLQSPIIYQDAYSTADQMRTMLTQFFNPKSCAYHYLSMANGNFRDYLKGDTVRLKKYFYILRPILACDWIEQKGNMPPTEFAPLLTEMVPEGALREAIENLITRKMAGEELSQGPQLPIINEFAEARIHHHQERMKHFQWKTRPDTARLDQLFRDSLAEAWST